MLKKTLMALGLVASGVLIGAGLLLQPVHADPAPKQQFPALRIHVIDVGKVFKNYAKFNNLQDNLKGQAEAKNAELVQIEKRLRGKVEAAKEMANPADRDRIEKEIADLRFEGAKLQRNYQEELQTLNVNLMSTAYKELTDLLTAYCRQENIHMVLRLTDEPENPDPRAVLQSIAREVVYYHPYLDLTQVITDGLNARFKQANK